MYLYIYILFTIVQFFSYNGDNDQKKLKSYFKSKTIKTSEKRAIIYIYIFLIFYSNRGPHLRKESSKVIFYSKVIPSFKKKLQVL